MGCALHRKKMLWILFGLSFISEVHGYASGDFPESCQSMSVKHPEGGPYLAPQTSISPFFCQAVKQGDFVTVSVRSNSSAQFRGFMLEARKTSDRDGSPVGKFILLDTKRTRLLTCSGVEGSAVSKKGNAKYSEMSVNWTAQGKELDIVFRATIVQSTEKFWERMDFNIIPPTTTQPPTTTEPSTTTSTTKPATTTEPSITTSTTKPATTTEPSTTTSTTKPATTTEPSTTTSTTKPATTTEPSTTTSTTKPATTTEPSTTTNTKKPATTTEPSTTTNTKKPATTTEPRTTTNTTKPATTTEPSITTSTKKPATTTEPSTTTNTTKPALITEPRTTTIIAKVIPCVLLLGGLTTVMVGFWL